jgi:hypothetical protein
VFGHNIAGGAQHTDIKAHACHQALGFQWQNKSGDAPIVFAIECKL